jgi:EAL domain-containing protein (putative c-di-GMP-specific phosphodiesterase class I)
MTMSAHSASAAPGGTPWLEHFLEQGGPAQKTLLTSFPFTIGRNDTADLPIKSSRVSREHASILRAADTYRIRDLDSTNGTFLNGERIEEATLADGDILLIADLEFTFFSGAVQAPRTTVTQVIGFRDSSSAQPKCLDLVRSVRRLQETLLHGGYAPTYRPVVDLRSGRPVGSEAVAPPCPSGHAPAEADRLVLGTQSRLAIRLRELFCMAAAEESLSHRGQKLFLPLESNEIDLGCLESLLARLAAVLPDFAGVIFEVPDTDVNDVPYFHRWYGRIRDSGAGLCYRDFAAGRARLEEHRKTPPDFIKLSASMVRGVWQDASRRAACETLMKACRELDCQAIAAGMDHAEQIDLFLGLGCPFGQGSACQKQPSAAERPAPITPQAGFVLEPVLT